MAAQRVNIYLLGQHKLLIYCISRLSVKIDKYFFEQHILHVRIYRFRFISGAVKLCDQCIKLSIRRYWILYLEIRLSIDEGYMSPLDASLFFIFGLIPYTPLLNPYSIWTHLCKWPGTYFQMLADFRSSLLWKEVLHWNFFLNCSCSLCHWIIVLC